MLLVIERSLRRRGVVLGLLQPLLELAVEKLALLSLGAELLLEALLALGGLGAKLVERGAEIVDRARRRWRLVRDEGAELRVQRELGLAARALDGERRSGHGATLAAWPEGVKPCDNAADGRARQRIFLVAQSGQYLSGVSPPVLLPLLRRLGRVGRGRDPGRPAPLHPQAARVPAAVGGAGRARRDRDGVPRLRRRARPPRRGVHRRRRRADAPGGAVLLGRPPPVQPPDGGGGWGRVS